MRIFESLACAGAVFIIAVLVMPPATACTERKPTQETGHGPHDYSFLSQSPTLWKAGDPGEPLFLKARILNTCGQPVEGAEVQVLHANHDGEHEPDKFRGVYRSDKRGQIKFVTVFPGYTGGLPRHIHFIIRHPKHPELVTRLFFLRTTRTSTTALRTSRWSLRKFIGMVNEDGSQASSSFFKATPLSRTSPCR